MSVENPVDGGSVFSVLIFMSVRVAYWVPQESIDGRAAYFDKKTGPIFESICPLRWGIPDADEVSVCSWDERRLEFRVDRIVRGSLVFEVDSLEGTVVTVADGDDPFSRP